MKKNKSLQLFGMTIIVLGCLGFLYAKGTYTAYETKTEGDVSLNIAKWDVKVNNTVITTTTEDFSVDIDNISWNSNGHISMGKGAPGLKGKATLVINPGDTDVSFRYDLEIIDKSTLENNKLLVTDITTRDDVLIRTGEHTYTGIFTKSDVVNGKLKTIFLDVEWPASDDIDLSKESQDDFSYVTINMSVSQYLGEEIVPYTEGE